MIAALMAITLVIAIGDIFFGRKLASPLLRNFGFIFLLLFVGELVVSLLLGKK